MLVLRCSWLTSLLKTLSVQVDDRPSWDLFEQSSRQPAAQTRHSDESWWYELTYLNWKNNYFRTKSCIHLELVSPASISNFHFSFSGLVTNIPPSMVTDQFGMIGLLTFIRAAETDPNLVSLALGADLTTLGLNLNSEVNLYPTFGGPWAETPCRPQDIDFHVPFEYLTNSTIR